MSKDAKPEQKQTGIPTIFGTVPVPDPLQMTPERVLPPRKAEAKPEEKPSGGEAAPKPDEKKPAALGLRESFLDMMTPPRKTGEKPPETDEEKARRLEAEKKSKDDDEARRKASELSPERIAQIAAAAAGEVVNRIQPQKPAEEAEPDVVEPEDDGKLPERYQEDADVYTALSQINPEKYGDITKRIAASDRKERAYIAEWKKKNPGAEFDPDDEAHNAFYDEIEVKIPEKDLKSAREKSVDVRAARVTRETIAAEDRKRNAKQRSESDAAEANRQSGLETLGILKEFDPSLDLVGVDESARKEVLKRIADDKAVNVAFEGLVPVATERFRQVHLLASGQVAYSADNPHHVAIVKAATEADALIRNAPKESQMIEGREYVSPDVYSKLPRDRRDRYWTVGPGDIAVILRRQFAETLKIGVANTRRMAREIAGLPPEEGGGSSGGSGGGSNGRASTFSRGSVLDSAGGRPVTSRRGSSGAATPEDAFFKNVGGS